MACVDLHIGVGLQTGLVLCKLEYWCGLIDSSELMGLAHWCGLEV